MHCAWALPASSLDPGCFHPQVLVTVPSTALGYHSRCRGELTGHAGPELFGPEVTQVMFLTAHLPEAVALHGCREVCTHKKALTGNACHTEKKFALGILKMLDDQFAASLS